MEYGPDRRPRHLLIAGDPALSRGLMGMVLSRLGYLVSVVGSGTEALALRPNRRFSAALVAVRLPDMAGLTLARHLAAAPCPVPVLLFGDPFDRTFLERDAAGLATVGFLAKPLSLGRLVAMLTRLADEGPATSAPEPVMSTPSLLDRARLAEFTNGDPALERELVSLFVETAALYLDEMAKGLEDPERWRRAAHALKGAAANVGARELAALAAAAERDTADRGLLETLAARLNALRGELGLTSKDACCAQ